MRTSLEQSTENEEVIRYRRRQKKAVSAWHFISDGGLTTYRHGGIQLPVMVGKTLEVEGPIKLCKWGLHFSKKAFDALKYAEFRPVICRVEVWGDIIEGVDKGCAEKRTCIAKAIATPALNNFAIWCAHKALLSEREQGREPETILWEALNTARKYANGKLLTKELNAEQKRMEELYFWRGRANVTHPQAFDAASSVQCALRSVLGSGGEPQLDAAYHAFAAVTNTSDLSFNKAIAENRGDPFFTAMNNDLSGRLALLLRSNSRGREAT